MRCMECRSEKIKIVVDKELTTMVRYQSCLLKADKAEKKK